MEEFRLLSIDELDELFVAERKKREAPAPAKDSLIPAMEQNAPEEIDLLGGFDFDSDESAQPDAFVPAQPVAPAVAPAPAAPAVAPPPPLYASPKMSDESLEPLLDNEDPAKRAAEIYAETKEEEKEEKKSSPGAIIGKGICIAVLVLTVLVFICGSFISVFLDTQRSLGKYVFSTQAADITGVEGLNVNLKQGDLIISEKIAGSEYKKNDLVPVPSATAAGCDLTVVDEALPADGDNVQLSLVNLAAPNGIPLKYSSDKVLGKVVYYVPMIAGLIGVALQNTVLVIIIFIIIAVLCCALFVLIDKMQSRKSAEDEYEDGGEAPAQDDASQNNGGPAE